MRPRQTAHILRSVLLALALARLCACGGTHDGGGHSFLDDNFPPYDVSKTECEYIFSRFVDALTVSDVDRALSYCSKHVYWHNHPNEQGQSPTRDQLLRYSSFVITYQPGSFTQHQDTAVLEMTLTFTATARPEGGFGNLTLSGTQHVSFFYEDGQWLLYGIFSDVPATHNEGAGSSI